MHAKHKDLQCLLNDDTNASEFFSTLPVYVKDQIRTRSQSVNTIESLQAYADKLLRGDD